ncbi:hypothetical protein BAE44_0019018 [Dichanthelium oligosanthes]|uniref:Uncharacterized protein n=1 Tax=Dichanthelium oligosanthes TaxID=888268 RepID=A0A1E5V478_9POAL|nr:hypothetical protein BAE44_0019018 [Dichanthelium oligosanthes]
MSEGTTNCIDILIAIILPPLGVFLKFVCKLEFWICLLLTVLSSSAISRGSSTPSTPSPNSSINTATTARPGGEMLRFLLQPPSS